MRESTARLMIQLFERKRSIYHFGARVLIPQLICERLFGEEMRVRVECICVGLAAYAILFRPFRPLRENEQLLIKA